MKIEILFKRLIILYILLFIAQLIIQAGTFFEPVNLDAASEALSEIQEGTKKIYELMGIPLGVSLLFDLFLIILYFFTLYSLYKFKHYSRNLFIITLIIFYINIVMNYSTNLFIISPLRDYLIEIVIVYVEVSILILAYFSPIKEKFIKKG